MKWLRALAFVVLCLDCSGKPACDATSCQAGCCDANGACVAGDDVNACGAAASGACSTCTLGSQCLNHSCVSTSSGGGQGGGSGGGTAASGGGSGATGGGLSSECPQDGGDGPCLNGVCVDGVCTPDNNLDGGTGGGSGNVFTGFSCSATRVISTFGGPVVDAGFNFYNWLEVASVDPTTVVDGGTWDALDVELNQDYLSTQPVPGVSLLDGGDDLGQPLTYFTCGVCPLFYEACAVDAGCARAYFGVSGTVAVASASQTSPGSAFLSMQNVTLVEWDLVRDRPVPDSGCVQLGSATIDAGW